MKIEIVRPDAVSTTEETFTQIDENVYKRDSDGAIMVMGIDQAALIEIIQA